MDTTVTIQCDICNSLIFPDYIDEYNTVDGMQQVCNDCKGEMICCGECGLLCDEVDLYYVEGTVICETCYDNDAFRCYICDGRFFNRHENMFGGEHLCGNCYESETSWCIECDEHFWNDDLNRNCICERCASAYNSFDGNYTFYKLDNEPHNSIYFGIELEAGMFKCVNFTEEILDEIDADYFILKDDSSIGDCERIVYSTEIVSHPMTYNWLKAHQDVWNKVLELRKKGLRSYVTNSCGIHIHLSKKPFTEKHLYRFMKMIYSYKKFTSFISQRRKHQLKSWSSVEDGENLKKKAKDKYYIKRYTAVNLGNDDTIEIRIFRGTLCPRSFWKNIEYIQALIEFTAISKVKELTIKNFLLYISNKKNEFPNLYSWLKDKQKIKKEANDANL